MYKAKEQKTDFNLQRKYISTIKSINEQFKIKNTRTKTFTIKTFGCQMNAHDSEKLIGMLTEMDYKEVFDEENSDLIIYNTCCVRENAENKVYGNLGYLKGLKQKNKNLKIIICGCMMQQNAVIENIKQKYKHVDIIFGTFNISNFPQLLATSLETNQLIIDVWDSHGDVSEDLPIVRKEIYKASVNIMYGCNNFCTYCIVPYVRGRERSREKVAIIKEIKLLVSKGLIEVTLLGQNVNSYGLGLESENTFPNLLREINKIEGLKRIRFMTSHPKDISEDLIYAIRDCNKVCNHLHLPCQSGSDRLLKLMNRKYTREDYLHIIAKAKKEIPDLTLSTDIIVGFPTETKEDIEDTIKIIREIEFTIAFTYQYSKREGTPAFNMEGHINQEEVTKHFNIILGELKPISEKLNKKMIGKKVEILIEGFSKNDKSILTGRTEGFQLVHVEGKKELIGTIQTVTIEKAKTFYMIGKLS